MTVFSGDDLRKRLGTTDWATRLVVSPLLVPDEQLRVDQASIDVRLGCRFALAQATVEDVVDSLKGTTKRAPKESLYVPLGDSLVLHPHQFLLGETMEFVRLPLDAAAYVIGRSVWGREGLIVATAVGVHPGWSGCITLEIRNLGEIPIRLFPGDLIAQLFLHRLETAVAGRAGISQFRGSLGPITGDHRYGNTSRVLASIVESVRRSEQPDAWPRADAPAVPAGPPMVAVL